MKSSAQIIKVISVEDTRDYIEENDRFVPLSGTGILNECERCGRSHEVHATVALSDGTTAIVGTGCCRGESMEVQKALRAGASKAKKSRRDEMTEADVEAYAAEVKAYIGEFETRIRTETRARRARYLAGNPVSNNQILYNAEAYIQYLPVCDYADAVTMKTARGRRARLDKIIEKIEDFLSKITFAS